MQKPTARESRRARREAKRRRQRILLGVVLVIILAAVGFLVYSALNQPEENAAQGPPPVDPDVETVTTESGLQYQVLEAGEGTEAGPLDLVSVHYTGWLEDGTKFDSSLDRNRPLEFALGTGGVIQGWDEGLMGMREGGRRRLIIPPELAYGAAGSPPTIPPDATLIFDVELVDVR